MTDRPELARATPALPGNFRWPLGAGVFGTAVLLAVAVIAPSLAARAWLTAVVVWIAFPIGALFLLLIHGLTGGRWGEALAPQLRTMAFTLAAFVLLFVPVFLSLPMIYPWASGAVDAKPDVTRLYLNPLSFILRCAVSLIIWTLLAILNMQQARRAPTGSSATALVVLAVTFSFVAVDWVLSLEPHYVSSTMALELIAIDMLSALALVALRSSVLSQQTRNDVGQLMLGLGLGLLYLAFISFLVDWSGNLPTTAFWYNERTHDPKALGLLLAALALGLLAIGLLASPAVRRRAAGIRAAGAAALGSIAAYQFWLILPGFGLTPGLAVLALVAITAVGGLWLALALSRLPGTAASRLGVVLDGA
jgi:hypothetical protein